jgi:glycosyltransferase involved in cell wall biosynthesis
MTTLRIAVHDFVGHAFQTQLSRELARRGHRVQHLFFQGFASPNDCPAMCRSDPPTLSIEAIILPGTYPKYQYVRRVFADRRYSRECIARLSAFSPNVVISANASPAIQGRIQNYCRRNSIGFLNWVQDFYGLAAEKILSRRLGLLGKMIGGYVRRKEEKIVRSSDAVVFISDDFQTAFPGMAAGQATVIENWAPLGDLPARARINDWSVANDLVGKKVLLYSGTLGLKHNPELLIELARELCGTPEAVVVVVSEGLGRAYLERRKRELRLSNLMLFDFQPFGVLPDVTASADVLIAMIEKEAGVFSVPSKVLTYLCARRPLLLAVPSSNLAARIVAGNQAGIVVDPADFRGFTRGALELLADPDRASALASNGWAYARSAFNITRVGDRFETVLTHAIQAADSTHASRVTTPASSTGTEQHARRPTVSFDKN